MVRELFPDDFGSAAISAVDVVAAAPMEVVWMKVRRVVSVGFIMCLLL